MSDERKTYHLLKQKIARVYNKDKDSKRFLVRYGIIPDPDGPKKEKLTFKYSVIN